MKHPIASDEIREAHLRGFARAFVVRDRRARFLEIATSRKRRDSRRRARWTSVLAGLEHWVDPGTASKDADVQAALWDWDVERLAARCPAEDCYVMTDRADFDDRVLSIREALEAAVSCGPVGFLVSVVPGELAFYEQPELARMRTCFGRPAPQVE